MADRKNKKGKRGDQDNEKATKEEYAVAKYVRFNCPTLDAKFVPMQNMVKCFYGNKAIDTLMDSKWAKSDKGEIYLPDRKTCVAFMQRLMMKGLLHRATKVERSRKDRAKKKKKDEDNAVEEEKNTKKEKRKLKDKENKEVKESDDMSKEENSEKKEKDEKKTEDKDKEKDKKKEKKERKLKLDMADEQWFTDGNEIYVWIYDPVPLKTFVIGLLMVIGAAALCLFPLWPDWMRVAVYYISLVGASFVGLILVLAIIRGILFCAIWIVTLGKLHFWFLPNLTEDVGFFDSFKPLYTYTLIKPEDNKKEKKKKMDEKEKKELEDDQGFEVLNKEEIEEASQEELERQEGEMEEEEGTPEEEDSQEEAGVRESEEEREGETKKTK